MLLTDYLHCIKYIVLETGNNDISKQFSKAQHSFKLTEKLVSNY